LLLPAEEDLEVVQVLGVIDQVLWENLLEGGHLPNPLIQLA
jgi:hypothetical protein